MTNFSWFSAKLQCANSELCVHFVLDFHWYCPKKLLRITRGRSRNWKPKKGWGDFFFFFLFFISFSHFVSWSLIKKYFFQNFAKECQSTLWKMSIRYSRKMKIQPFPWSVLYYPPLTFCETSRCLIYVQSPSLHGEVVLWIDWVKFVELLLLYWFL